MKQEESFTVTIKRKEGESFQCKIDFADDDGEPSSGKTLPGEFRKLSDNWTTTCVSFFEVVPFLSDIGYFYADRDFEQKTQDFLGEHGTLKSSEQEDGLTVQQYDVPFRELELFSKTLGKISQLLKTAETLKRSALGSLVSEYEAFWVELLAILARVRPTAFLGDEFVVTEAELTDYDSIEELRYAKLQQALDDILHGKSHIEVLDFIGKKFGGNLLSDKKLISEFVEVCQRRHLITHAGAKVNKRYLRICLDAGCDVETLPKLGENVTISRKYLRRATARIYQVGFFSLHLLWQKLLRDTEGSDSAVLNASHTFLENDLTKMARRISKFSLERKSNRPHNVVHAYLIINQAQTYAFDKSLEDRERIEGVEKCLSQRDWSMKSALVELVLACLRREYEGIDDKVVAAATVGEQSLQYPDVFTWNVFREARDNSTFIDGVTRAFGSVVSLDANRSIALSNPDT
ncbi:hypothetical protein [Ruegeria profundi]|uniref:hypothetical protein n=1 Tax=Ruegeria profundi TaxID=1685378 RepID=UPI003C7D5D5A